MLFTCKHDTSYFKIYVLFWIITTNNISQYRFTHKKTEQGRPSFQHLWNWKRMPTKLCLHPLSYLFFSSQWTIPLSFRFNLFPGVVIYVKFYSAFLHSINYQTPYSIVQTLVRYPDLNCTLPFFMYVCFASRVLF